MIDNDNETESLIGKSVQIDNYKNISFHVKHDAYTALYIIMVINVCNGFSFSSMFSILAIFLNENLHYEESFASFVTNATVFCFFTMALTGGFLADYYCGKVKTIFIAISCSTIGTTFLYQASYIDYSTGMTEISINYFYIGLLLFTFTGMSLPAISALVGDQFIPMKQNLIQHNFTALEVEEKMDHAFGLLYTSFNIGAMAALMISPNLSYLSLFKLLPMLTLIGLILLTISFRLQYFVVVHQSEELNIRLIISENHALFNHLLHIYAPLPIFWGLFYCIPSLWTFSAKRMNRNIFGFQIPAGSVSILNPLLDIILIQVFDKLIYPYLRSKGISLEAIPRMITGMIFTGFSLYCAALLEIKEGIHILYILPQYFLMSCGEILLSITALEYSYQKAPSNLKTILMSSFFFTQALGNLVVAFIDYFRLGTPLIDYLTLGTFMLLFCLSFTKFVGY